MEEWIKMRRAHLVEQVEILEKNAIEYQKIDLSELDDTNKENINRAIEDSQKLIDHYTEEIKLIDRS